MTTFTLIHLDLSLVALLAGLVVLWGLLTAKPLPSCTAFFLTTSSFATVSGFFAASHDLVPYHIVDLISLLALALAIYARYLRHLLGVWRSLYVVSAVIALSLNASGMAAQAFMKISALKEMASIEFESPFKLTQMAVLLFCALLAAFAVVKFRDEPDSSR